MSQDKKKHPKLQNIPALKHPKHKMSQLQNHSGTKCSNYKMAQAKKCHSYKMSQIISKEDRRNKLICTYFLLVIPHQLY